MSPLSPQPPALPPKGFSLPFSGRAKRAACLCFIISGVLRFLPESGGAVPRLWRHIRTDNLSFTKAFIFVVVVVGFFIRLYFIIIISGHAAEDNVLPCRCVTRPERKYLLREHYCVSAKRSVHHFIMTSHSVCIR